MLSNFKHQSSFTKSGNKKNINMGKANPFISLTAAFVSLFSFGIMPADIQAQTKSTQTQTKTTQTSTKSTQTTTKSTQTTTKPAQTTKKTCPDGFKINSDKIKTGPEDFKTSTCQANRCRSNQNRYSNLGKSKSEYDHLPEWRYNYGGKNQPGMGGSR